MYAITVALSLFAATNAVLALECVITKFDQVAPTIEFCTEIVIDSLTVPSGEALKLYLQPGTHLTFRGTTTFEYNEWEGPLVELNATNVVIRGEEDSILNPQGKLYWDGQGIWGSIKPKFSVMQLHDSVVDNLKILNPPVHCIILADSSNVSLSNLLIDASEGDPAIAGTDYAGHNTDGFVLWNSTDILIRNSTVYNQDDCINLRCGTNIVIDSLLCYGSHGLSVSVGFTNDSIPLNTAKNITFSNSILKGGENGIHLKTHVDGGEGLMEDITYQNIQFENSSKYGINIQENYRDLPENGTMPTDPRNNVPIKHLKLSNIKGQVRSSAVPIYILCADDGCFDWEFENVEVTGEQENRCNYLPIGFSC